jgi:hypothetical protein
MAAPYYFIRIEVTDSGLTQVEQNHISFPLVRLLSPLIKLAI